MIENNLSKNIKKYQKGLISKKKFINENYKNFHSKLFEYQNYLKGTGVKNIQIFNDNIIFTMTDKEIKMSLPNKDVRATPLEIFNFKSYELKEANMMKLLLRNKKVIFDIGANLGWYSLLFSIIHSFEPIPNTFNFLKKNIEINDCRNITLNNIALSNSNKRLPFFYTENHSGMASSRNLESVNNVRKFYIKAETLDNYCEKYKINPDFIKCDVEGAELMVFLGAKNVIEINKPIVFSEILRKWTKKFNYNPNNIFDLFYSLGYHCYTVYNSQLKKIPKIKSNTIETNFFFLHKQKHKKLIEKHSKYN